ncbi:hypothetical protein ABPG72_007735 [Tetrahymena utriculariae]
MQTKYCKLRKVLEFEKQKSQSVITFYYIQNTRVLQNLKKKWCFLSKFSCDYNCKVFAMKQLLHKLKNAQMYVFLFNRVKQFMKKYEKYLVKVIYLFFCA